MTLKEIVKKWIAGPMRARRRCRGLVEQQENTDKLIEYFSRLEGGVPTCISTGEVDCLFRNLIANTGGATQAKHLEAHCRWKLAIVAGIKDSDVASRGVIGALKGLKKHDTKTDCR